MLAVSAVVYASDYSGSPTPLEDSSERTWHDPLSDCGVFSLRLENDDDALAACAIGNVVRLSLDGEPAFAGLIEAKTVRSVALLEKDEFTEVKGRGTMALNDSFVVYPERLSSTLIQDVRPFTAAALGFDDSGWPSVDAVDQTTVEQFGPVNFPSTTAKKIRPGGSPITTHPPEEFGTRKAFTTPDQDRTYRLFFTGDDGVDVWVDGVRIVQDVRPGMWQETRQVDIRLNGPDHVIYIGGTNLDFPAPNYSWVIGALYSLGSDGTLVDLIVETDDSWIGVQYAGTPPGYTPGAIIAALRDEALARGVDVVGLSFDALVDTAGNPWPAAPDASVRVGLKGVATLLQLAETYVDLAMDPATLTLHAWVRGTKGTTSPTVFTGHGDDPNVTEMTHEVVG